MLIGVLIVQDDEIMIVLAVVGLIIGIIPVVLDGKKKLDKVKEQEQNNKNN
jgi:F0F1-type ATP synthase assembly protein I